MKKYVGVPFLAIVLLAWPTFSGLFFANSSGLDSAHAGPSGPELALKVDTVRKEHGYLEDVCQKTVEPYSRGMQLPDPVTDIKSESLKSLPVKGKSFDVTRQWVDDFLKVEKKIEQIRKSKPDDSLRTALGDIGQELKKLAEPARIDKPGLLSLVTDRDSELVKINVQVEQRVGNAKLLQEARVAFDAGRYDECLATLRKWQGSPDDDLGKQARVFNGRAKFRVEVRQLETEATGILRQPALDVEILAALVKKVSDFVQKGPPESAPPEDLTSLKRFQEKHLPDLKGLWELAKIGKPEPGKLGAWAGAVKGLDDDVRKRARVMLTERLTRAVGEKKTKDDIEDFEEAETNAGELLQGRFVPHPGPTRTWYGFFKRGEKNGADVVDNTLSRKPGRPLTVLWVQKYMEQRKVLLREIHNRAAWEAFRATCQDIQTQIPDYQVKRRQTLDVSVDIEMQLAEEVLQSWEQLEPLLQP